MNMNNLNITSTDGTNVSNTGAALEPQRLPGFTPERHAGIAAVKAALKTRPPQAVTLHVLYNVLRGLDPRRGFSLPKGRGVNAHQAFLQAARAVPRLAEAHQVALDAEMRTALQDACRRACIDNAEQAHQAGDAGGRLGAYQDAMEHTPHGPASTVAEHGHDCARRYSVLRSRLASGHADSGWPDWLQTHGAALLGRLQPTSLMATYLRAHDIGKVTTLSRDAAGRCHFTGHAAESERLWLALGGSPTVARLMGLDMALHTLPAEEVEARVPSELVPSLLLATYVQLLSNAESVFGGQDSDSFKMKLKALNKRAKRLCAAMFESA